MSVYFEIEGEVACRDVPEVREIAARFNTRAGGITCEVIVPSVPDGSAYVEIGGGTGMTQDSALALEGILRELCPHAREPVIFVVRHDGDAGFLYVGPPEKEAATVSGHIRARVECALDRRLQPDDALALISRLIPSLDQAGRERMVLLGR